MILHISQPKYVLRFEENVSEKNSLVDPMRINSQSLSLLSSNEAAFLQSLSGKLS